MQRAEESRTDTQLVDQTPGTPQIGKGRKGGGRRRGYEEKEKRYKEEGFYFLSPGG